MALNSYGRPFHGYNGNYQGNTLPNGGEAHRYTPPFLFPAATGLSPNGWLAANFSNKLDSVYTRLMSI